MIVLTGAAGFIGSNIAAALIARGDGPVIACDRFGRDERWQNVAGCPFAEIVAPEQLADLLHEHGDSIDAIIHMGAISATTETDVDAIIRENIQFTTLLWSWCTENRVRFIYASSAATYGAGDQGFSDDDSPSHLAKLRPLNAYGWSKHFFDRWVIERRLQGHRLPHQWAGLKFFNVYGPNEYHKGSMKSVIAKAYPVAAAGKPVSLFRSHRDGYADGGQLRDFVYVKDCVRVVCWLLDNPGVSGLFNVGTGAARSFADLVRAVFAAIGNEPKIEYIDMPSEIRSKYQYYTQASMQKLRNAGYSIPFTSLEDGVRDYVQRHLATEHPYAGPESYGSLAVPSNVRRAG